MNLGLGLGLNKKNGTQKQIVRNGLVLYLDGKDFTNSPPTTTWRDRSGLGNNAIPSGMAYTTSSGSDGMGGVVFDGVNDYVSLPQTLLLANNFTYFTKLKLLKLNTTQIIMNKFEFSNFDLRISSLNCLDIFIGGVGTTGTLPLMINTMYSICIIKNVNNYYLYLDNNLITTTNSNYVINDSYNLIIAAKDSTKTLNANILQYNNLMYNRSLSDAERTKTYNALR